MTPSRRLQKDIRELSLKALDGQLSDDEQARLNSLVESEDDACRLLLQYSMLDADLIFHARSEAAGVHPAGVERVGSDARQRNRAGGMAALFALAAAVLVAVWLGNRPANVPQPANPLLAQRQPQPIASLTLAPNAVFQGRELAVGEAFLEGEELTLLEGEAHVSMSSGADFILKSPGSLRFVSAKHVRLLRGVMTAQVAEWGTGFTVDTETMRVIDLGTRFAIDASMGEVEAHVLQGQIRVQPLKTTVDGRRSVLLSKGEALRVDQKAESATRMTAEEDRFPESHDSFRPFKPIEMHNTGVNLAEGDEDPHWRIAAGPVGAGYHGPQFGVVSVPHERYAPNEPKRSQWISFAKDLAVGANANSLFTFETEVDLTGFDLQTVMIAAQVLADNGVRAMRINGEPVEMKPWDDNEFGQSFTRNRFRMVEIQSGFVPGVNKIEIDVWNGVYQFEAKKNDPNPMSVRVEFQAYGRLIDSVPKAAIHHGRSEAVTSAVVDTRP
jgi:hypothetical protein